MGDVRTNRGSVTVTQLTDKDAWMEDRSGTIGASSAGTLLGCNPWRTPLQLFNKLSGEPQPEPTPEAKMAMMMGNFFEDRIGAAYRLETLRETKSGALSVHRCDRYRHQHASPDFIVCGYTGFNIVPPPLYAKGDGVLEVKLVGPHMMSAWGEGAPNYVQAQLQQQMACMGLEWGSIAACLGGTQLVWYDYPRDDALIERLADAADEMMMRVKANEPPDACAGDLDDLKKRYGVVNESATIKFAHESKGDRLVREWEFHKKARDEVKRLVDEFQSLLLQEMGNAQSAMLPDGRRLKRSPVKRKGYVVNDTEYVTMRVVGKKGAEVA